MPSEKNKENADLEEYLQNRDSEANEGTLPPVDEKIRIPALWAFEVYTPSYIESFHKGISKFGWEKEVWGINSDVQNSIDELRSRSSGSGRINLGYIVDESSKDYRPGARKAKLPEGVHAIKATVLQLLPSTTIFACQFVFTDELADSIEDALNSTYTSYEEPTKDGHIQHDVSHQKEDAVILAREYLKDLCSSWFVKNFPGLFSSGELDGEFPFCEFITFKKHIPSQEIQHTKWYGNYLSMLRLSDNFDNWKCDKLEGLFLQLREGMREERKFNLVLFGNINEILATIDLKTYGSKKEQQVLSFLTYIDRTLGTWVLFVIAKTFERSLSKLRDAYGELEISNSKSSTSLLLNLDKKILHIQKNTIPFVHELKDYCEHKKYYMHDVYEFKAIHEMRKNQNSLFSSIRENLLAYADLLYRNEKSLRNTANASRQIASVESSNNLAQTNIGLQNRMFWMTAVILLLTIITSAPAIKKIVKFISESELGSLIMSIVKQFT